MINLPLPDEKPQIRSRVTPYHLSNPLLILLQGYLSNLNRPTPLPLHNPRNIKNRPRIPCNMQHIRHYPSTSLRKQPTKPRHNPSYIPQPRKRNHLPGRPNTLIPSIPGIKPKPRPNTILQKQSTKHPTHLHTRIQYLPRELIMPLLRVPF